MRVQSRAHKKMYFGHIWAILNVWYENGYCHPSKTRCVRVRPDSQRLAIANRGRPVGLGGPEPTPHSKSKFQSN